MNGGGSQPEQRKDFESRERKRTGDMGGGCCRKLSGGLKGKPAQRLAP